MPSETVEIKNKRRSERVSVDFCGGKVISEATVTQVVNAHGGLLSLRMEVESEQKFLLKNLKTGKVRECSVVRTERAAATSEQLVRFNLQSRLLICGPSYSRPKTGNRYEIHAQESYF